MTDTDAYLPIPCSVYDALELAILRRERLRVAWREPGDTLQERLLRPLDLETRAGEEFLIAETDAGERVSLRLDRLVGTVQVEG